jgi:hypothetical protein
MVNRLRFAQLVIIPTHSILVLNWRSYAEHISEVEAADSSQVVRLLPAFDHYVVAAPRDREAVLPEALKSRVYRPQGWLSPVLLVDGRIEGVWSHERKANRLIVEVETFRRAAGMGTAGGRGGSRAARSLPWRRTRVRLVEPRAGNAEAKEQHIANVPYTRP